MGGSSGTLWVWLVAAGCTSQPEENAFSTAPPPGSNGITLTAPTSAVAGAEVLLRVTAPELQPGDRVDFGYGSATGPGFCPFRAQTGGTPCLDVTGQVRAMGTAYAADVGGTVSADLTVALVDRISTLHLQAFLLRGGASATSNVVDLTLVQPWSDLDPRVSDLEDGDAGQNSRLNDHDSALSTLTSRTDDLDADLTVLEGRVDGHDAAIALTETAVTALEADHLSLAGRLTAEEAATTDLYGQIAALQTSVQDSLQALMNRVTAEESATTDLYDLINGLAADVADLMSPPDFRYLPTAGCVDGDTIVMRSGVWQCEPIPVLLGSTQARAGASCNALYQAGVTLDGTYWIDTNGGSTSDAIQLYCLMSTDGGGWTLVSKSNGADRNHYENGQTGLANLQDAGTSTSGYVGDTMRLALGKCYRVHTPADSVTKFAYVTNTFALNSYWAVGGGNATQPTVQWSNTFSTDAASYTTAGLDDGASLATPGPRGPAYAGTNWGHGGATGTRMFTTANSYGRAGLMFVKDCIP